MEPRRGGERSRQAGGGCALGKRRGLSSVSSGALCRPVMVPGPLPSEPNWPLEALAREASGEIKDKNPGPSVTLLWEADTKPEACKNQEESETVNSRNWKKGKPGKTGAVSQFRALRLGESTLLPARSIGVGGWHLDDTQRCRTLPPRLVASSRWGQRRKQGSCGSQKH